MKELLTEIRQCTACKDVLPNTPNPIIRASKISKILVVGQAPGQRVHDTGIPWNDPSGNNLRQWMGVDKETFYDENKFALVPMGFCYPGTGKSGDLPPRPECAQLWHNRLIEAMTEVELTLLIGQYAQRHFLGNKRATNLTQTVENYAAYLPHYFPLPHPSPRNNIWQKKNEWFKQLVIPELQATVASVLHNSNRQE